MLRKLLFGIIAENIRWQYYKNPRKMKRIFVYIPFFFVLLLVSSLFFSSCGKHPPTSAIITVVDSSLGVPVVGATVQMYIPESLKQKLKTLVLPVPDKQNTDAKGETVFTVKHVAIYYAKVYLTPTPKEDTVFTLVRFEEEKTTPLTIKYKKH